MSQADPTNAQWQKRFREKRKARLRALAEQVAALEKKLAELANPGG